MPFLGPPSSVILAINNPVLASSTGVPGIAGLTGAFLSSAAMGEPSYTAAVTDWQAWTGIPLAVSRQYYALSSFPTVDSNLTYDIAHGIKCCLDLRPAFNPTSATDLANLTTMLAAWKAAGLQAEVSLWAEPFNNGLNAAQYIAMVNYYGPTVRQYYPLVFCTSALSVQNNSENTYYPGDAAVDKIATDLYAIRWLTGTTLDQAASLADNASPPKPFGLWEFGAAPQGSSLLVGDNANFEVTAGTWTGAGNATTPRSTLQAHTGVGSLAFTSVASGTMDAAHCAAVNITTQGLPCAVGDQIVGSAWVLAATATRTVQAGANFYTSGGAFISSIFDTVHGITDSTSVWTQVAGTVTAPATAAFCRLDIRVLSTGGASEVHYLDDCSIGNNNTGQSQADVTSYFAYLKSYFTTRISNGNNNADLIMFNSGGASGANASIVTPILGATDYRISLWQSLRSALLPFTKATPVPALSGLAYFSQTGNPFLPSNVDEVILVTQNAYLGANVEIGGNLTVDGAFNVTLPAATVATSMAINPGPLTVVGNSSIGQLFTVQNVTSTPSSPTVLLVANAAADRTIGVEVNGDGFLRWRVDSNGLMQWGTGSATQDVALYRQSAQVLRTDNNLSVGGTITGTFVFSSLTGPVAISNGLTVTGGGTVDTLHVTNPIIGGADTTAADILPDGVRAAGAVGKLADAGHQHQNNGYLNLYLAPTGALAETFPRSGVNQGGAALLVTTDLYLKAIPLPANLVINNISFVTGTTAAGGVTHGWYTITDANRIIKANTTDQGSSTIWGTTSTLVTLALTTGFTVPSAGLYYIGVCMTASTPPTLASVTNNAAGVEKLTPFSYGLANTGLAGTLATGSTATSLTVATGWNLYGYVS